MRGFGERLVQRIIADLEEAGLVKRIARHRGKLSNEYDLTGLVNRLKEIEPEFRAVEEEVKQKRRSVARPGLKDRRVSRSVP